MNGGNTSKHRGERRGTRKILWEIIQIQELLRDLSNEHDKQIGSMAENQRHHPDDAIPRNHVERNHGQPPRPNREATNTTGQADQQNDDGFTMVDESKTCERLSPIRMDSLASDVVFIKHACMNERCDNFF